MKDYSVTIPDTNKEELAATISELFKMMDGPDFAAELVRRNDLLYYDLKLVYKGEIYADEAVRLSQHVSDYILRFCERVNVQRSLDSMHARMVHIGWDVTCAMDTATGRQVIRVKTPQGSIAEYKQTGASMTQLQLDLNVAEVDWLIGNSMPLFLNARWRITKLDDGAYMFREPDGSEKMVNAGDVEQAKKVIQLARAACTAAYAVKKDEALEKEPLK